ncbi:hypothetical protein SAMN04487898_107222 [Pedobacter sp. ok626]|nr:hypothetical protein SAMN04487898_107222 [Pedobacter sp. ok626]
MFNEPPYAERHVRWCEGTGNQIMITFLLYAISGSPNVSFQNYLGFCCNLELVITSWGISKVNLLSFGKSV